MAIPASPDPHASATLLASAGWAALQDRLVMSLCHDLNGRIASLQAARQLAELGDPVPTTLATEMDRLERVSGRLADLVGFVEQPPRPVDLRALMDRALDIHAKAKDAPPAAPTLRVEGTLPAVLTCEGRCLRALLLLIDCARTTDPRAVFTLRGDGSRVELEARWGDDRTMGPERAGALEPLDALLEIDGGGIFVDRNGWTARLPSLRQARDQGR